MELANYSLAVGLLLGIAGLLLLYFAEDNKDSFFGPLLLSS